MRPPAQVLTDFLDKLTTLLTAEVSPANQAQHNMEIAKLRDEVAQAKEDLAAEDARMTTERAVLDAQAQQIQASSFRLSLDQNTSNEIMRRRN